MKPKPLRVGIRIPESQNAIPPVRHMKNEEIKRQRRSQNGVSEPSQPNPRHEQHASGNPRAGDCRSKIRLKDNQPQKYHRRRDRRKQRIAPVVHGLGFVLQKPRQKQDQRRLGQLRRLQRYRTHMKPAMRPVRAIQKKHRNQKKTGRPQKRKNQRRMLQPLVIHLHRQNHRGESRHRKHQLLQQEFVSRSEPLLGHHRRSAEDHHQPDKHQDRSHGKHPAIDANPLRHIGREPVEENR